MGLTNNLGKLSNMITSTGSAVGIGIISPTEILDIFGSSSTGVKIKIKNNTDGLDNVKYAGIDFVAGSDNGTSAIRSYRTNSGANYETALAFLTNPSGGSTTPTEKMRITSAGNVGIGTSSPAYTFDVKVATNRHWAISASGSGFASFRAGDDGYNNFNRGEIDALPLLLNSQSGGNVGIGSTNPLSQLEVKGGTPFIRITDTTTNSETGLIMDANGAIRGGLTINYGTGEFKHYCGVAGNGYFQTFHTNGSERMRITSGGQVIIGNTNSLYTNTKLAVSQSSANMTAEIRSNWGGDAATSALIIVKYDSDNGSSQVFQRFANASGGNANGQINGNGAAQVAFGSWSDSRLKDNIENLPSQLSNIMALRPVEFDYKNGSGHQIGFIAQEMKEVYPDAVGEDSDGFLTITGWSKTEARLVKSIQELEARIKTLENK